MLEPRYRVTSGHLLDSESRVSPQIDIIIADNFGLSSLLTTQDGTEYIPITSVLAIGEVKSTYYKSKGYYAKVRDDLKVISGMTRPLTENTAYGGIKGDTLLTHSVLPSKNMYLNSLYSFMLCIDGGDFDFADIKQLLISEEPKHLPGTAVFLNKGVVAYGVTDDQGGFSFSKYPGEVDSNDCDWCYFEGWVSEGGSLEGCHLAFLYGTLVEHLSNCHLGPPSAYRYTAKLTGARSSSLVWAKGTGE